MYKYFQPNDKDLKDNSGDCAVRAVCLVEDISWLEAYDIMYKYSRVVQSPMNCKIGFEEIMRQLGYTYVGVSNKKGSKRPTVAQISKTLAKENKKAVAVVSNHYVGVKDGNYYDVWDSGYKSLYGYWVKER